MKTNDNVATWRMILRCRSRLTDTRWRRFTCQRKINKIKSLLSGESTLDLCYANQRKFRSDTYRPRHATENCRNHHCGDDSILLANVTRDPGLLAWVLWGASVWGIGLAGCRFLCAGKYIALLIEHEWGGPQHPAHEGVKSPGILFMTWRAQGVMNGWLLVFLSRMCCHKAS